MHSGSASTASSGMSQDGVRGQLMAWAGKRPEEYLRHIPRARWRPQEMTTGQMHGLKYAGVSNTSETPMGHRVRLGRHGSIGRQRNDTAGTRPNHLLGIMVITLLS